MAAIRNFPVTERVRRAGVAWLALVLMLSAVEVCAQAPDEHRPPDQRSPVDGDHPGASNAIVLEGLGRGTQMLSGYWQFHEGDDLAWASPEFDDSAWQAIEVGRSWEGQGHRDYTGFAWYRKRLVMGPDNAKDFELALLLSYVDSACEVYWNGVKVRGFGKVPPRPVWYASIAKVEVVQLGKAQSGVLALRVWKAPIVYLNAPEEGGLLIAPVVGSVDGVTGLQTVAIYRRLRGSLFEMTVARVCGIVGAMALLLWLRNRKQRMLMWLAAAMFSQLGRYFVVDAPVTLTFRLAYGIIGIFIALNVIALWFLLIELLGLRDSKGLVRWTWIVALTALGLDLVDSVCQLFDWTTWPKSLFLIIDVASATPAVYAELWGLVIVFAAFGKRMDGARWTLAIAALVSNLVVAVEGVTGLGARWTHLQIARELRAPLVTIDGDPVNAEAVANTFLLVSILYAAWRMHTEQRERQTALELEMHSARVVQQVMIPDVLPSVPGFKIESAYKPAGEVGGDFFQIMPVGDGGLVAVIGDVSGKGMPAALTVSMLVGTLRTLVHYSERPGAILAAMNKRMLTRSRGGFATCLVVSADADGSITAANAGHLAPYVNGKEVEMENGLPLGIAANVEYAERVFRLHDGDQLTLLTDGVIEARSDTGELLGFDRARELSTQNAKEVAQAAEAFGQDDDITVLTVTFAGTPVVSQVRE